MAKLTITKDQAFNILSNAINSLWKKKSTKTILKETAFEILKLLAQCSSNKLDDLLICELEKRFN